MPWYDGPALLEYLDTVRIERADADAGFRLPVQWVQRPDRSDSVRDFSRLRRHARRGTRRAG
jgi:bifunctional enzyme CysN/CysC